MIVNVQKLMTELESAGIPVAGCASDGRIDFKPEATSVQRELAGNILAAHDPNSLTASEIALKTVKDKADANPVDAGAIANASTIIELRDQVLKMQAQIEYLLARTNNPSQ